MLQILPITAAHVPVLRELRLRALQDSPDSFGATYEDALAQPDSYWEAWASGGDGRFQVLMAFDDAGQANGLISCGLREGVGGLGALWVTPEARGTGLGRALMEAGIAFLESHGRQRIELSVTDGNPAERLYKSLGFVRTGARKPLHEGSPLWEVTMARESH